MSLATEGVGTVPRPRKSEQQRRGERAAGQQLHELLRRPGAYRRRWETEADSVERGQVNQAAVCKVLGRYLLDAGEKAETGDLARTLRDPVSKALRGVSLSNRLLRWFVAAFDIDADDAEHLRLLHQGELRPSIIVGHLPPPAEVPGYRVPEFDVLKLQEHHWLGPDGLPARHRTQTIIRSRIDGLANYQYRIDTPHARVRALRGGEAGDLYEAGGGIWAVDLTFPHPLRQDEDHYIEFWTLLKYDVPPPRELRRGSHERIEQLDIRVEFHPGRLPNSVWWAEWEHYTGEKNKVTEQEQVELDEERAVHRYVEVIERTVVGFYWEW